MAEAGLVAGAVVEGLDVVEQDRAHLGSGALADGSPDVADLVLQRCPEGLHRSVVEAITDAAVAANESPVVESVGELERRVLGSVIRVVNRVHGRVPSPECHLERGDNEVGGLAFAHRPSHERAVTQVTDAG